MAFTQVTEFISCFGAAPKEFFRTYVIISALFSMFLLLQFCNEAIKIRGLIQKKNFILPAGALKTFTLNTSLRKEGKTGTIFLTCEKSHDQWDCFSSKREDFYSVREFALSEFQYFSITLDYAMQICIILQPPSAWQE